MDYTSHTPYILRAFWEWAMDNGVSANITVAVNGACRVPMRFVQDGLIVLNISDEAVDGLVMDNDTIRFAARFGGKLEQIVVPVPCIVAIFSPEAQQGMNFELEDAPPSSASEDEPPPTPPSKPGLRVVT